MHGKWIKVAAWAAGIVLVLFLAVTVAVWLLLPAEKIKSLAEQRITAALGRECTIEGLGLSLWHGLALDLAGVELAPGEGEHIPYTARLEHLYLKMKLLPLLQRRVEVVSLSLDSPEVFIVRDKGGGLNLSKLGGEKQKPESRPEDAAFNLLLMRVAVQNAVLHYHDHRDSSRVTLAGIGGEINMLPGAPGSDLPLNGKLNVEELREFDPGSPEDFAKALPASARFDGAAAGDWSWIELSKITFAAGGVQLDGPLRLDLGGDSTAWKLELEGGATDPALLSELVLPADFPRKIDKLELKLATDGNTLTVERLDAAAGADRLSLSGTVVLAEPYRTNAVLDAALALEGLKDFSAGNGQWSGGGELSAKLNVSADLAQAIETWRVTGIVSAGEIRIALPDGRFDIALSKLRAKFAGRDIEQASLTVIAGGSDLSAELTVNNWPGFLPPESKLSSGRARWKLAADSKTIDFVELFGQDHALLDTLIAGAAKDTSEMPIVLGEGFASLRVGNLIAREGVALEQASLWMTVHDSLLRLDSLAAGLFDGKLSGGGSFVLAAAGLESWQMNLRADNVQAGQLLRPFSSIGEYLKGTASTEIELRNDQVLAASSLAGLAGAIDFSLSDGAVRDWPALNMVSSLTNIGELRDLAIDDWIGRFEIHDGRVFGDNLKLHTAAGLIGASGSVGLDGSLDYDLTLALNQRLSDKYRSKLPGEIGRLFIGGSGQVELAFDLGGTTTDPNVKLNTKPMVRRAGEQLKQGVSKLIRNLLPGGDTPADSASADSIAADSSASIKKALPGLLNKLLKKSPSRN
ncbi:AsmA family protein [Gemmatimonadota bacterium]